MVKADRPGLKKGGILLMVISPLKVREDMYARRKRSTTGE